jgi:hypothetical protein
MIGNDILNSFSQLSLKKIKKNEYIKKTKYTQSDSRRDSGLTFSLAGIG